MIGRSLPRAVRDPVEGQLPEDSGFSRAPAAAVIPKPPCTSRPASYSGQPRDRPPFPSAGVNTTDS